MRSEATVFVVDDDAAFRQSIHWMLEKAGLSVETFSSAERFLEEYDPGTPGCLLLDVRMGGMSGLDLQQRMAARRWCTPVIIITAYADVPTVLRAMDGGAVAFIEKPFSRRVLLEQIRQAIDQDAETRRRQTERAKAEARFAEVTPREREVMQLVVAGKTTKQIARQLGSSARTIEVHRAHLMKKMHADSLAQLVVLAVRFGLGDSNDNPEKG